MPNSGSLLVNPGELATMIFREFLANQTIVKTFFIVHITQEWHFQTVTTKQFWLSENSYQSVFKLSQSYYQIIVNTFLRFWMNTWRDKKFSTKNSQNSVLWYPSFCFMFCFVKSKIQFYMLDDNFWARYGSTNKKFMSCLADFGH